MRRQGKGGEGWKREVGEGRQRTAWLEPNKTDLLTRLNVFGWIMKNCNSVIGKR
jgi:hypothetical protein